MAELIILTTPVTAPTITDYHVIRIDINRKDQRFLMAVESNTGKMVERMEVGQVALDLMIQLNKANLTIKSLERRVLEYMASKGDFTGSVTGTPD